MENNKLISILSPIDFKENVLFPFDISAVMLMLGDYMKRADKLLNLTQTGKTIPVCIADTFGKRFMGLMGRIEGEYGLLLSPCNAVHTFFMRYDLDVIFLDKNNRIVSIKRSIKPFSVVSPVPEAVKVLELPSSLNATDFLNTGDQIVFHNEPE